MKKSWILFLSLLVVFVLAVYFFYPREIKSYELDGITLNFRADLRRAQWVEASVEHSLDEIFLSSELRNITLVFVDSPQNALVAVQAFEIASKLSLAYRLYGYEVTINATQLRSYENLRGNSSHVLIALIPPYFAEQTRVLEKDFVVRVEATSLQEFDLATVKFLMLALGIEV